MSGRALDALEQLSGGGAGAMQPLKNDPAFDRLQSSPRFRKLKSGAQQASRPE